MHGDFQIKFSHIPLKWHWVNKSIAANGNETLVWREGGLSPPMPHLRHSLQVQSHLWKLLAAGDAISTFVGNMPLNLSNPNNSFHIQLYRNTS